MSYKEKAASLHASGYNCAQAVVCAFADKIDVEEKTLFKLAEGFGRGMGNMEGSCGAISGAIMAIGFINSDGNKTSKVSTYGRSTYILDEFKKQRGTVRCKDLKTQGPCFTPCRQCVELAAELLEKELEK